MFIKVSNSIRLSVTVVVGVGVVVVVGSGLGAEPPPLAQDDNTKISHSVPNVVISLL